GAAAHQHPGRAEPPGRQPRARGIDRQAQVRRDQHGDLRAVRRPARGRRPGRVRLRDAPHRGPGADRAAGVVAPDVPAGPGQLDRGRHVRDPAQHPGPADARPARRAANRQGPALVPGATLRSVPDVVDLSHVIAHGTVTYPGLPGPVISDHLSREASHERYAPGYEFQIGRIEMVSNTGTYLDTPFHRFPDGHDLAGLDPSPA